MATVIINPDKTISLDGKKIFITALAICNEFEEAASPCNQAISVMKDTILMTTTSNYAWTTNIIMPKAEAAGMWFMRAAWSGVVSDPIRSSPKFFGYEQCDEPISTDGVRMGATTQALCESTKVRCAGTGQWINGACYYPNMTNHVISTYNNLHTGDPSHLVMLNLWEKMLYWSPYCDIITWDTYPFVYGANIPWSRGQSLYAYEIFSEQNFFKGTDLHSIKPPVWAVIQSNTKDYSEGGRTYYTPTKNEMRANLYSAICMDVRGVRWWPWQYMKSVGQVGLVGDINKATYANQIYNEIKSINNVLVGPTLAYQWFARGNNTSYVTFNKKLTSTLLGKTLDNWSWILKQEHNSSNKHLIVVNKDPNPVSNVTIIIPSVNMNQVKLLGLQTSGSGAAGRVINAQGNSFTDSFDGLAVHIYSLTSSSVPCNPSTCSFEVYEASYPIPQ